MDRGRYVRTAESYLALAGEFFSSVEYETRHDLLRVPYDHFIMACKSGNDLTSREAAAEPQPQG
jgi:hypothetical protein